MESAKNNQKLKENKWKIITLILCVGIIVAGLLYYYDLKKISKEKSQEIASDYLRNSPTFKFDGMEDTLKLVETNTMRCPYCWGFVFEFQSRHAGYGNRSGQILAQVITFHTTRIVVREGEVVSAIMDDKWDIMRQKMI
ncbi:MAG: hypothetical protein ACE5KT_12205 [Methanosarcinales archaeon]